MRYDRWWWWWCCRQDPWVVILLLSLIAFVIVSFLRCRKRIMLGPWSFPSNRTLSGSLITLVMVPCISFPSSNRLPSGRSGLLLLFTTHFKSRLNEIGGAIRWCLFRSRNLIAVEEWCCGFCPSWYAHLISLVNLILRPVSFCVCWYESWPLARPASAKKRLCLFKEWKITVVCGYESGPLARSASAKKRLRLFKEWGKNGCMWLWVRTACAFASAKKRLRLFKEWKKTGSAKKDHSVKREKSGCAKKTIIICRWNLTIEK